MISRNRETWRSGVVYFLKFEETFFKEQHIFQGPSIPDFGLRLVAFFVDFVNIKANDKNRNKMVSS